MTLAALTSRQAVLEAITEFEQIGREAFLSKYGFGKSRSYFIVHDGTRYDSKAVAGAAYGFEHPSEGPLTPDQFSGGEQTVARRMKQLGFNIKRIASQNPDWTEDELILALDLYLRRGLIGTNDPEIVELSELLRSLPIHPNEGRTESFRNTNGVTRKLSNLANFDPTYTGKPTHGNRLDGEVYNAWATRPDGLSRVVDAIKSGNIEAVFSPTPEPDEEDVEAPEGRLLYRQHRVRERNQGLRGRKIAAVLRATGMLTCEVCGFNFEATYGERGVGFIECHHVVPLHEAGPGTTRLSDLALVCSNCHRMIHRKAPWPTPSDLAATVQANTALF